MNPCLNFVIRRINNCFKIPYEVDHFEGFSK